MFLLGTWKYVSVKIVQSYSVFHALSNGVVFIVSARSQKFDPVDMEESHVIWTHSWGLCMKEKGSIRYCIRHQTIHFILVLLSSLVSHVTNATWGIVQLVRVLERTFKSFYDLLSKHSHWSTVSGMKDIRRSSRFMSNLLQHWYLIVEKRFVNFKSS